MCEHGEGQVISHRSTSIYLSHVCRYDGTYIHYINSATQACHLYIAKGGWDAPYAWAKFSTVNENWNRIDHGAVNEAMYPQSYCRLLLQGTFFVL